MDVGITATRNGLSKPQKEALTAELQKIIRSDPESRFHHGDCKGGDEWAHYLASALGFWVIVHPPMDATYRAFCRGNEAEPLKPYLQRNHDIVECSQLVIGCPDSGTEKVRSGTWATIRYARKTNHYLKIITPTGIVHEYGVESLI